MKVHRLNLVRWVVAIAIASTVIAAAGVLQVRAGGVSGFPWDVNDDGAVTIIDVLEVLNHFGEIAPTPAPTMQGLSRDNPVPQGQSLLVPEGWDVSVVQFISDATEIVLAENQFNDPPEPGMKFAIVRVRMTNVGADDPDDPDAGFALRLVGSRNLGYSTFTNSCGVIPDDIRFMTNDVFRGGTVEGNVCYEVGMDETGFVIFTDFFLSDPVNTRWFAVN